MPRTPMSPSRLIAVVVLPLLLAGCGSSDKPSPETGPSTKAEPSTAPAEPSTSPTEPPPVVSIEASCGVLDPIGEEGLMEDVDKLLFYTGTLGAKKVARLESLLDSLDQVAAAGLDPLAPQVQSLADQARLFLADAYDPDAPPRPDAAYEMASSEIWRLCNRDTIERVWGTDALPPE